MRRNTDRLRVLVAGGGFAAAEAALALRAYASDRVDIEIVSPESHLRFRPASTISVFGEQPVESFSLAALGRDTGAVLFEDRLEAVAPDVRRVRLATGAQREYDALVLAVGARARVAVPGALTFRDQRDSGQLRRLLDELWAGELRRIAVAVPAGPIWSVPAYEIALLLASEVERHGLLTEIAIVTPESAVLEVFGTKVSGVVAGLLADADVQVVSDTVPRDVDRRGLRLLDRGTVAADRVIALPRLVGPRLPGVPPDFSGFIPTRALGRVDGVPDVYAAGDMISFPVKQGGVAAQQADAIAAVIALRAGASPAMPPPTVVLRTQLFGAPRPTFLEAVLDGAGHPLPGRSAVHAESPWWPKGTLFGRHVSAWMAQQALAAA